MKLGSPKRRQLLKAQWLASRPAVVPVWAYLARLDRLILIRDAFKAGVSAKTVGEWLGVTRSAVLGCAWKQGLLPSNADTWTPARGAAVVAAREEYTPKPRKRRVPQPREATRAKKRALLPNLAKDLPSYQAINKFNALNCTDARIADELQVEALALSIWRRGHRPVPPYILPLVDEVVAKLGPKA